MALELEYEYRSVVNGRRLQWDCASPRPRLPIWDGAGFKPLEALGVAIMISGALAQHRTVQCSEESL